MAKIPENWTDLRAAARGRAADDAHVLGRDGAAASKLLDRPAPVLARVFGSAPDPLARLLATAGAGAARPHLYLLDQALPRLLGHGDAPAESAPMAALHVVSYVGLARCLDAAVPGAAEGLEARWLRILARKPELLDETGRHTAALAAVAVGETDVVPSLVGGGLLRPHTERRSIAGPNIAGLARYWAEVSAAGGGPEVVEDAWWSFLRAFPLTLAADGARWIDLVWAATAMMVRFEHRAQAEVATFLPRLIDELASDPA